MDGSHELSDPRVRAEASGNLADRNSPWAQLRPHSATAIGRQAQLAATGPCSSPPKSKVRPTWPISNCTDGKRNQAASPRPLMTASSQQAWLKTHCTRLPKHALAQTGAGKLSLPRTNPAQLYFKPKVKLTHVTTTVKHADYLPAWA